MADAFICDFIRTPIGRYAGALADVRPDDLAAQVLAEVLTRNPGLPANQVDEVIFGCANQAGEDNRDVARMALLLAGMPVSVPGVTVNRLCGSGLDAVLTAARSIQAGACDVVLAGGVESMSRAPFVMGKVARPFGRDAALQDTTMGWRFINPALQAAYGTETMPETAENVAEAYGISRADQDAFALRSQTRVAVAQGNGRFAREIMPVTITDSKGNIRRVNADEHPRTTDIGALARLPAPFREGGTVTAGNASGINDGAAALIIASGAAAMRFGLTPVARIVGGATAGVEPRLMGIGPVDATHRALARTGLTMADIDLIELNEAFAAQAIAVLRALEVPEDADHVNPNGGAIALGHPLGMSGARIAGSLALELVAQDRTLGLASMCVGVGQGISMVLERV
jgi:acetyl-CoA acyltransferase